MDGPAPLNTYRLTLVVIFTALAVTSVVGPAAAPDSPAALESDEPVFQIDPGDSTDTGNESAGEDEDESDEDTSDEEASDGNTATRTRTKKI